VKSVKRVSLGALGMFMGFDVVRNMDGSNRTLF
jgi:hypothetical protein